jgi:hypothetical protein
VVEVVVPESASARGRRWFMTTSEPVYMPTARAAAVAVYERGARRERML